MSASEPDSKHMKSTSIRYTSYLVLLAAILLSSCRFRQDEIVDFTDLTGAQDLKFKVISQHETDLSNGLPYNCYLPDGSSIHDYSETTDQAANGKHNMPQTSSVTGAAIIQELLKYGKQNQVIEIVGTYPSYNGDLEEITLSGKVMLPKGRKPKRLILVSHYTVGSNAEAPRNSYSVPRQSLHRGFECRGTE